MEDKEKIIDQSRLAEDVAKKIPYEFEKQFLVKPLDPVMVQKEFSKPVSDKEPKKDDNGIEAVDYEEVETEVKEVESDYAKGIVLKIPFRYAQQLKDEKWPPMPIKCGDVLIYKAGRGSWFDLVKDTRLVDQYDVIGIENVA